MIQAVVGIVVLADFLRTSSFRKRQSIAIVEQLEQRIDVFILERVLIIGV